MRKRTMKKKMNELKDKITGILVDNLGLSNNDFTDDARFYEDLGVDSLDFYAVIAAVEKALQISIPDDDAARLRTPGLLFAYAEKKAVHHHFQRVA